jgi:hypothetical protein
MSLVFTKNLSNYLSLGIARVGQYLNGAPQISFSCWANFQSLSAGAADNALMSIYNGSNAFAFGFLIASGTTPQIRVRSQASDAATTVNATTNVVTNKWFQLGTSVDFGTGAIIIYLNGLNVGTGTGTFGSTTYVHSASINADSIGCYPAPPGSTGVQAAAWVSDFAFWRGKLTNPEWISLAQGIDPRKINRVPLKLFWEMFPHTDGRLVRDMGPFGQNGNTFGSVPFGPDPPRAGRLAISKIRHQQRSLPKGISTVHPVPYRMLFNSLNSNLGDTP